MPRTLLFASRLGAACAVLLLLVAPFLLAGCSDPAPESKPAASADSVAGSSSLPESNSATGNSTANATVPLAEALAGNASLLAPDLTPEAANATLAACALPVPEVRTPSKVAAKAPAKVPAAKPAKATASAAPAKAKARSGPLTLEQAQQEFTSFARQWVAALSRNMLGNAANMAVAQEGGGYVARFAEVEQDTMEVEVKATDLPTCPFVGVLKYFECSYEARGDSPEAAKSGAFSRVRKVRVTELFRHSGTRWE